MVLGLGKSVAQEQQTVHAGEAFEIWQHLVMRYDIQELTDIFQNFADDLDFKALLSWGLGVLKQQIGKIEDEMNRLGIPMPTRPPKSINTPSNSEVMRDELMYRRIYMGVQNFLNEHQRTLLMMKNQRLRSLFLKMQQAEIEIYAKLVAYGTLKGWLQIPPEYKGSS